MIGFWALLAAVGLVSFVSGLPAISGARLRRRVEPYALGFDPLTSVRRGHPRGPGGDLSQLLSRVLPSRPDLNARLTASDRGLSVDAFRLEQVVWGFSVAAIVVLGAVAIQAARGGVDLRALPVLGGILFASGFLGRDWWLTQQIERRYARLRDELPAAIDLITLSIMAGESVATACGRVSQAMPSGLGEEFERVTADVRGGLPILEALERFAMRVPEVGVGRFVDALCVGIEKGAPLAETLRAQADDGREARRRYLLEVGGRREVLMLVPVVFLIMPVVVVFALYPGLVTLELLVP